MVEKESKIPNKKNKEKSVLIDFFDCSKGVPYKGNIKTSDLFTSEGYIFFQS